MKHVIRIIIFVSSLTAYGQVESPLFNEIYQLIEQKHFFKAKEIYHLNKNQLSFNDQLFTEAVLDNAFNRLEDSNEKIAKLIVPGLALQDSLALKLLKIKGDNFIKVYNYKEAKNTFSTILNNYKNSLSEEDVLDIQNSEKIWKALEHEPKQQITINKTNRLKIEKDKADLNTLKIAVEKDTLNFVFDTGANISTTCKSVAKQFKMKIIPVNIEVHSITGVTVQAQLAVCRKMTLGDLEIRNSIFLVFDDKDLSFPQIDYRIYGIIGFPIIEAFGEIQITQDGYFIVPDQETKIESESNLAMNELTPLIHIDGKHFSFDTGADRTILYSKFYIENQQEIDAQYTPTIIQFGGAGGSAEFEGYEITETFNILGKTIQLDKISLLKEKVKSDESVYGNIGQDVIRQFNSMTINFNQMFIKFD